MGVSMGTFKDYVLFKDQRAPLVIESSYAGGLLEFVQAHRDSLLDRLLAHGALLFRGFAVKDAQEFDGFITAVSPQRMDYVYGSTPRKSLGNGIFTATEYPPNLEIPLHNESSYQKTWPLKIALCCLVSAASYGETPIADIRQVSAAIGPRLMDKFERRRVQYVRHYRPFIDVSWQEVFQTEDRNALASFCEEHEIQYEWLDSETLFTSQICQGVASHPISGERVFFNQAHLFHLSSLGEDAAKAFSALYGSRVPRQTYFGNGEEISIEDLTTIREAFDRAKLIFPWQSGDVLLADNMQVAHGRRPFKGVRKVIAALMEPYSERGFEQVK
jgi:alpha-ketoglutarate-dependent taurine dioxygenase